MTFGFNQLAQEGFQRRESALLYWLLDMVRARANPGDTERCLLNTATQDGKRVRIGFGQDPGQAGKAQALHLVRALSGFTVRPAAESGDKLTRFGPFSSQCRAGARHFMSLPVGGLKRRQEVRYMRHQ